VVFPFVTMDDDSPLAALANQRKSVSHDNSTCKASICLIGVSSSKIVLYFNDSPLG
jgi:hypothetical protein